MVRRIIVDNSVLVPLFFSDEDRLVSDSIIARAKSGARLLAPEWALIEFASAMCKGVRHRRIVESDALGALEDVGNLPIEFQKVDLPRVSVALLAWRRNLSFYDAIYLKLALDEGAEMATLDKALKDAAIAEGVGVISEVEDN